MWWHQQWWRLSSLVAGRPPGRWCFAHRCSGFVGTVICHVPFNVHAGQGSALPADTYTCAWWVQSWCYGCHNRPSVCVLFWALAGQLVLAIRIPAVVALIAKGHQAITVPLCLNKPTVFSFYSQWALQHCHCGYQAWVPGMTWCLQTLPSVHAHRRHILALGRGSHEDCPHPGPCTSYQCVCKEASNICGPCTRPASHTRTEACATWHKSKTMGKSMVRHSCAIVNSQWPSTVSRSSQAPSHPQACPPGPG